MRTLKYKYYISATLVSLMLSGTSCIGDLDTVPLSPTEQTSDNVFGNEEITYVESLAKIYAGMAIGGNKGGDSDQDVAGIDGGSQASFLRVLWNMQELPTDMAHCAWSDPGIPGFNQVSWGADSPWIKGSYYRLFYQINLSNAFLRETTDEKLAERRCDAALVDKMKEYRAEARFLRALNYWYLLDLYRNVPLVTEDSAIGEKVLPSQVTPQELYDFIETELTESLKGLPTRTTQFGRFDKGLAYTILMKYYMHEKNWAKAEECGRELLKAEYGYGLMDRYADIFTLENEGNKEIIFACTEERGTNLQLWHDHALPGNYPTKNTSIQKWDGYKVPWPFYRTFEEGDDRLSVLVGEYVGTDGVLFNEESDIAKHGNLYSGAVPVKYGEDPESTGDGSQIDLVVYRYADVLTLLSEAIVRKGNAVTSEALDLLNQVRVRAKLNPYTMGDVKGVDDFLQKVLDERGHELWFEGVRRSDLIRHGQFIQNARDRGCTTTKDEFVLFPLPQAVINEGKGKIVQNPGY